MMVALRAHHQISFKIGPVKLRAAVTAFLPDALGDRTSATLSLDSRWNDFFVPTHDDRIINE